MEKVLELRKIEATTQVLEYVESHAQNKEILRAIAILAKDEAATYYTILPSQEPFAKEDVKELSVGWRIFPPGAKKLREARTSLLENMLTQFLALGEGFLCLLPSEFQPNSSAFTSKLTVVHLNDYPYIILDQNCHVEEIRLAQNSARGFLYNCLLVETNSNQNLSVDDISGSIRCIVLEAYDGDSYLLIVPKSGNMVMNEIFNSVLHQLEVDT